jgi:hypothetical protein
MQDFYFAGGLRALTSRVRPYLHLDALTVNGHTIGENIEGAKVINDDVIRPLDNPIYKEGALAVLYGNLAPDGCVIKPSFLRLFHHAVPCWRSLRRPAATCAIRRMSIWWRRSSSISNGRRSTTPHNRIHA